MLEDEWPSQWLTVGQAEKAGDVINAKRAAAPWARKVFDGLVSEAETVLAELPRVPIEPAGWRHDYFSPLTAAPLRYDPDSPDAHMDPLTGEFHSSEALRRAWVLLTHERSFKLMRSLGLFYAATGDERYAAWVREGMLAATDFVETAESSGWERDAHGGSAVWYQPLYDASSLLALSNAYALTRTSGVYDRPDHDRIRSAIFEARIPELMGFLQNLGGLQNMATYASAAVAVAGELYGREDWLSFGVGPEYGFVRWLEANVPAGPDGRPDGLWREQSTFYHFYALAPLITLYHLADDLSSENSERFEAMFEAPLHLVQPNLQFHLMGDFAAPGAFSLVDMRSFYEFAAGSLSPERFGPVLARIYARTGLERGCLWSLFYGPETLPAPGDWVSGHTRLAASGYGAFRDGVGGLQVGFRGGAFRGGHDHPDRLSVFIHAGEVAVAPDLGEPGYSLRRATGDYFRRTISHNTLFADERDNRGDAQVEWRFDRRPARAFGVIRNFEGVCFEREVFFDPPFVVLADRYSSDESRRFGWAFHARGELDFPGLSTSSAAALAPPFGMPPLPTEGGGYEMLTDREAVRIDDMLRAEWALQGGKQLEACIRGDGPFEATRVKSAGNPFPSHRGALVLRAPGTRREFYSVLEIREGKGSISNMTVENGAVHLELTDGSERCYGRELEGPDRR